MRRGARGAGGPRVVIVSRLFTPEAAAAAFRLDAVARAMVRSGAQVRVLTARPRSTPSRAHLDGVEVRRARTLRGPDDYIRGYAQYLSFDVPAFARVLLQRPRPHVLLVEPPPTTGTFVRLAGALRRIPYVYYAADVWSDAVRSAAVPRWVVAALRGVEGFALRGAQVVLAVNDGVAQRVRDLGARDVRVVPNGVDTAIFTPVAHRDPQMPERFLVYAGTASEWQGAGIFLDAFEQLRSEFVDLHLVYLGGGTDMEDIAGRTVGDQRVHVLGQRDAPTAAHWQACAEAALVSVVPGRGYDFAYPTKVLAALACGTPVVFAGVGPAREDVREAHLGAVADFDATAVAAAIRTVLRAPRGPGDRLAPGRLRQWVLEHRSLEATGRRAAQVVLGVPPAR